MRQWWNEDAVVVRNSTGSETSLVLLAREQRDHDGRKIAAALFNRVAACVGVLLGGHRSHVTPLRQLDGHC